jgi:serine phosphatase RsbU (regulator of sigma subunit)
LDVGTCLFLYTDGLIERRNRPVTAGLDILLDALTCAPADTVCATAMARMVGDHAANDDVAVLAVRRRVPAAVGR